jgi:hypothetical protein
MAAYKIAFPGTAYLLTDATGARDLGQGAMML